MKRIKSGFYENPVLKKNRIILNQPSKKRKNLIQSISERCLHSKKINPLQTNNNSNNKEDYKVKKVDIKFNILNNLKKFNIIYNNSFYQNIIKDKKDNNKPNLKHKIKIKINNNNQEIQKLLLNKNILKENYFNNNILNINQIIENDKFDNTYNLDNIENKENNQNQLDPHGYFPEDFSLNIYKSTSLYKNRYKIETCRLKKVLKNLYHEENSKKTKDLDNIIKKNTIENTLSIKMFKLLKARKIDRFVNRLLNIRKVPNINKKENSKNNSKRDNFFLTNKNKNKYKMHHIDYNDKNTKNNNLCIQPYSNIQNEKVINRNFPLDNIKGNNTANSATQTLNENKEIKNYYCTLRDKNKYKILNKNYYNNSIGYNEKNCNYKEIKFEILKAPKKNNFLKKYKKKSRPFSATRTNSSFLNAQNNNIINNFNKEKKLIFSFYDPKDRYIQLFDELEKKEMEYKY